MYAEANIDKYIIDTYFPDHKGIMVEVGAGPPEFYSMSKLFRDNGWRCVCIEPNPKFVEQHRKLGNEIYEYACSYEEKVSDFKVVKTGNWSEENEGISSSSLKLKRNISLSTYENIVVHVKKLNSILKEAGVKKIDFLSIDVEGWEIEVMLGFDVFEYEPKVILLENYEGSHFYIKYMNSIGYELASTTGYNYIFEKRRDEYHFDSKLLIDILLKNKTL